MLLIVPAAIALAAPAHADDPDNKTFLADIQKAGIGFGDPNQVATAGLTVCSLKGTGMSDDDVITHLVDENPGFSRDKATAFTKVATDDYCPPSSSGGTTETGKTS
jgi:hypothetical protein